MRAGVLNHCDRMLGIYLGTQPDSSPSAVRVYLEMATRRWFCSGHLPMQNLTETLPRIF